MEIVFKICGKEVDRESVNNPLAAAVLSGRTKSIERAVGDFMCSEHGGYPVIIFTGHNVENLTCDVGGCCNNFVNSLREKLNFLL